MRIDKNDPRLMDYALGELDATEHGEIEAALQHEENAEARQVVREFEALASLSTAALRAEPAGQLDDLRRAKVLSESKNERQRRTGWPRMLAAAAMLTLVAGGALVVMLLQQAEQEASKWAESLDLASAVYTEPVNGVRANMPADVALAIAEHREKLSKQAESAFPAPKKVAQIGINLPPVVVGVEVLEVRTAQTNARSVTRPLRPSSLPANAVSGAPSADANGNSPGQGVATVGRNIDGDLELVVELAGQVQKTTIRHFNEGQLIPNRPATAGLAPASKAAPKPAAESESQERLYALNSMSLRRQEAPVAGPAEAKVSGDDFSVYFYAGATENASANAQVAGMPVEFTPVLGTAFESKSRLKALGYLGTAWSYEPDAEAMKRFKMADVDEDDLRRMPRPPVRESGTEQYAAITERPFETVAQAPLSTFSIDVDTASYSNVRRVLTQGALPHPDMVRVEELVNYFHYDYAPPEDAHPFAVHVEMASCPWAPAHRLARIGLKGREIPRDDRPAGNFVFLLDVSGSMKAVNKLPLVKESMKALLRELGPMDRVGIVVYANESRVHLESTSCEYMAPIVQAIDALQAGGGTNGSAGIQKAYAMAEKNFIKGGINRVILATDGDFNVGVSDRTQLMQMIAHKARTNVFLTALGFGYGNLNDATLEALADKGNGNYAYLDTFSEARKVLVEQLAGTLITIAKDVKIQVEFNPEQVQAYRLIGYENRALAARDFNDDAKDAGEIGAGHTVTALYEIIPVGRWAEPGVDSLKYQSTSGGEAARVIPDGGFEMMNVKLRYKQPEGGESALFEVAAHDQGGAFDRASEDFRFAAAVAAFGMELRGSRHKAQTDYDLIINLAEASKGIDPQRSAFIDLVVRAKTLAGK